MKCDKVPIYTRVYRAVFSRRPKAPKNTDTFVAPAVRGSPEDLQSLLPTIDCFKAKQENMLATAVRDTLEACGSRLRDGHKDISFEIVSPVVRNHPTFKTQYKERVTAVLITQGYKIDAFQISFEGFGHYNGACVRFRVDEPLLLK